MVGLVTDAGLANVMAAWAAYTARPQYMQFGTGSGQTDTDTDLATPIQTRQVATTSQVTDTVAGDTYRITATIVATGAASVTEVGVFDALESGNLDIYGDFAAIALASGDAIVFQVNVTVS